MNAQLIEVQHEMKKVNKTIADIFMMWTRQHLERWAASESARTGKKITITDEMWKDWKESGIRYDDENALSDMMRSFMEAWYYDYQAPNDKKRCSVTYCHRLRHEDKTCCCSCILEGKGLPGEDI